jgi:hypothetical protein
MTMFYQNRDFTKICNASKNMNILKVHSIWSQTDNTILTITLILEIWKCRLKNTKESVYNGLSEILQGIRAFTNFMNIN